MNDFSTWDRRRERGILRDVGSRPRRDGEVFHAQLLKLRLDLNRGVSREVSVRSEWERGCLMRIGRGFEWN
jgi:hypothetical protein